MKNMTKYMIAALAGLAMLVSCNLDLEPSTAIVYDEEKPLFQSENDIMSFCYGVLASYRSLCSGTFDMTTDVMVDYFNATTGYGNNYGPVHRTDQSYTPSDDYVESVWASHYSAIKNYNVAISEANRVMDNPQLQPLAEYLQAIAYFCRASAYLTLTRLFGEVYDSETADTALSVPLVLSYDQTRVPERSTVREVYDQIQIDLYFAKEILGYMPGSVGAQAPTADAVNALMARYYLDTKAYSSAYDAARSVIASSAGYALSATKEDMEYEYLMDSGKEPVMQMYASLSEGTIAKTIYTAVGNDDNVGKYFSPYYLPSSNLLDAYDQGDLRRTSWFSNVKYPVFVNGTFYDGITVFIKYIGNPYLYSGFIETGAHAAKPIMISEMYLIAAEAACRNEQPGNAKKYLNQLQEARGAKETEGTLENIKLEWFREMVGSGHRFTCLKRWGDGIPARPYQPEAVNIVQTGDAFEKRTVEPGSHIFNFPIPAYEIQITPSLQQNRGYAAK